MHFIFRALFKVFFPLKAGQAITEEQKKNVRAKYGLKTILIVVLVFGVVLSTVMSLVGTLFALFYPAEKHGCFYCYDNAPVMQIGLSIPIIYFAMKYFLHQFFKENYEAVKQFVSVQNGFNATRIVKTIVVICFLLGVWLGYESEGRSIGFCEDGFEAKNFSKTAAGKALTGTERYSYKDIEAVSYHWRWFSDSSGTRFNGIRLNMKNGDEIELNSNQLDIENSETRTNVINRIMSKTGFTEMDTVEDE